MPDDALVTIIEGKTAHRYHTATISLLYSPWKIIFF